MKQKDLLEFIDARINNLESVSKLATAKKVKDGNEIALYELRTIRTKVKSLNDCDPSSCPEIHAF